MYVEFVLCFVSNGGSFVCVFVGILMVLGF